MSLLDELNAADRGFLTLLAARLGERLDACFDDLSERTDTRIADGRLVVLDLSAVGDALRARVGDARLSLPLSGLDALERLDVTGLGLDALDLVGLPALRHLACCDNRLRELDLGPVPRLETLAANGNDLMVLDLRGLEALQRVEAAGNSLATLVVGAGQPIVHLDVSRNQLMALDLPELPALEELLAYRNALLQVHIGPCGMLRRLDLARNDLTGLDLEGAYALERLALERNRLAALDLAQVPALRVLTIDRNYLSGLDASEAPLLRRLEASGNQLRSLDLAGHPSLRSVDVHDNRLQALDVSGCDALEQLRCAANELADLALRGVDHLVLLHVDDNELEAVDLSGCTDLVELSVRNNPLRDLDLRPCTGLVRLALGGPRGQVASIEASDLQKHRLAALRERFGLATGATELAGMSRWELHDVAVACGSTPRAHERLLELVRQPHCDFGTAQMVYWSSSPHYYLRYAERSELEPYEVPGWDLLQAIEERVRRDDFATRDIGFDPRFDRTTRSVLGHDFTADGARVPASRKRAIPAALCRPSRPTAGPA